MEAKRLIGKKLLRCGYTTGSCSAAASKAAAIMLLTGKAPETVTITTPKGTPLTLDVVEPGATGNSCRCGIKKDSGDDPDITNGTLVFSTVTLAERGVEIEGGEGVGRVTKPGLDQPVGQAAINSVPRRMIAQAVSEAAEMCSYSGGFSVIIDIPDGRRLAEKTFNPHLGIVDGISVLGTTGIVEPMSDEALADSIRVEISVMAARQTEAILITLGNYGYDYAVGEMLLRMDDNITCSNFIGVAVDCAAEHGFKQIMIIGHIGKLVKLGIGLFNTHSRNGDGRIETLCACALQAGAETGVLRELSACVTTDSALDILDRENLTEPVLAELNRRIGFYLSRRIPETIETGYVCFSNAEDRNCILFQSKNAEDILNKWRKE